MNEPIGEKTLKTAKDMISDLLDSYAGEINRLYNEQENSLTVRLVLKFRPNQKGGTRIGYKIAIPRGTVADGDMVDVDEQQQKLPLGA